MQPITESPAQAEPTSAPSATPAHLGWRLLAIVYDLLPLMAIWFATSLVVYLVRGLREVQPNSPGAWFELVLLWLVTGAYFVTCWARGGHTLGMRAWRLKVLAEDGRPPSPRALCLRYAVATASLLAAGLGFAWSIFDGERRCWHDIASGTRFVRMERGA
ncbi:MAG TPA: RDD family protein [Xanthomonadaceae bacterium]|jgi:uncharacterized RDD family membrane protein YckC